MSITIVAADAQKIKAAIGEISGSLTRIEAERDLIKEIIVNLSDEYQLDRKLLRNLAQVYHKNSFAQESSFGDDLEAVYTTVLEKSQ